MFEQSIIVYLSLISLMTVFGVFASAKGNYYKISEHGFEIGRSFWSFEILLPILLFAVVMGMRYDVGTDHLVYLESYLMREYVGKEEVLFFILSDLGWYFNFHYTVYFGVISFLQILFFYLAFKNERYLFPFLIIFLFTTGTVLSLNNVIRQSLAMCVWLYSLKYIENRNFYKYFLLGLILFLIHRSSIILFVFYPILKNGKDYFKSVPIQIALLILSFIINSLFYKFILQIEGVINLYVSLLGGDLYSTYSIDHLLENFSENEGTGLAYLFKIMLNTCIIIYSPKIKSFYNSRKFTIIYFFYFVGVLATYMFPVDAISLTRPFRYFYIFQPIMYAYLAYYFLKGVRKPVNLILASGLALTFLIIFVLYLYNSDMYSHSLYQFYFEYSHIKGHPR